MEHMDAQLTSFHSSVEKDSSKWRRSRPTTMPEPMLGDTIPGENSVSEKRSRGIGVV